MGTRSHSEQGPGIREVVGRGVVVVQDPGAPILRAKPAHSVAKSLQDCFEEFLIYRLSCRDELMMNQPVNIEDRNQHILDIGIHLPRFLRSLRL